MNEYPKLNALLIEKHKNGETTNTYSNSTLIELFKKYDDAWEMHFAAKKFQFKAEDEKNEAEAEKWEAIADRWEIKWHCYSEIIEMFELEEYHNAYIEDNNKARR